MAKRVKKPVKKFVKYSESLVRSLEQSLQSAFRLPAYIGLSRGPGKPVPFFLVQFANAPATARLDGGAEQRVVEVITVDDGASTFYLGFEAVFNADAIVKYFLHSASISIFHNIVGDVMPLFRAEWHEDDASSATSNHAQPHWHFVQRPERIERVVRNAGPAVSGELPDFVPEHKSELFSRLADCSKFHFAMTTLWRDRSATHKVFEDNEFLEWFAGLTKYIAGQIQYVVDKMPAAGPSFTPQRDLRR